LSKLLECARVARPNSILGVDSLVADNEVAGLVGPETKRRAVVVAEAAEYLTDQQLPAHT